MNEQVETAPEAVEYTGNIDDLITDPVLEEAVDETPVEEVVAPEPTPDVYKVKIDGEEVEMSLDELRQHASMGKAAQKRMQEAANERKKMEELALAMKSNPAKMFETLGLDPSQWAEQYLSQQLSDAMLSPEEKARLEEQSELQNLRKMKMEQEKRAKQAQMMQQRQAAQQEVMNEIGGAIAAMNDKLPQDDKSRTFITASALKMYAAERYRAAKAGVEPTLTMEQAINKSLDIQTKTFRDFLAAMDEDKIVQYLGDDIAKKLRAGDLKRIKASPKTQNTKGTAPVSAKPKAKAQPINEQDWMAMINGKRV